MVRKKPHCITIAVALVVGMPPAYAEIAQYQATFQGQWNPTDHPTNYPGGAHFSTLIGGTHNNAVSFWQAGGAASIGIERMAELGSTGPLRDIIEDEIVAGPALSVIQGSGGLTATQATTLDFEVNSTHPLVTLVTMVAPSPDWFVGVTGQSLLDAQNQWIDRIEIPLYAYDAGTEDGDGFSLSNPDTDPQGVITQLHGPGVTDQFPFVNPASTQPIPPLATLTFTLIPEPSSMLLLMAAIGTLAGKMSRRLDCKVIGCGYKTIDS